MGRLTTIGFDADDTLWQNEQFFRLTEARFQLLLADFAEPEHLAERLLAAEKRNLGHYGFGIKGFTLSMIETAVEVTGGKVPAALNHTRIHGSRQANVASRIDSRTSTEENENRRTFVRSVASAVSK